MLGQVGIFAHLAFTLHVRCAEHGELVEAGVPTAKSVVGGRATTEAQLLAADVVAAHGHDHCLIASHRRDRSTQSVEHASVVTAQISLEAPDVDRTDPHRSIALILLAPKNSPPA